MALTTDIRRKAGVALVLALPLAACEAGTPVVPDLPHDGADLPTPRVHVPLTPMADLYPEDAARLAVRALDRGGRARDWPIEIPDELEQSLLDALLRVHGATDLPARDSVARFRRIRTYPNPPLYQVSVTLDAGVAWADGWREGTGLHTGMEAVDSLVERYGLSLVRYYARPSVERAILRSERPLNIAALAKAFERVEGVRWAQPDGVLGDGPDIRAESEGDGWRLDYSIAWGYCQLGCAHRHTWTFRVDGAGAVEFLGSTGPDLPARAEGG